MRRREFITVLTGSAAWPLTATAQESALKRRIGALMLQSENSEQGSAARNSFQQGLKTRTVADADARNPND
jgi:hypothetical protein